MKTEITISESPLPLSAERAGGCGAVATFEGIVREMEGEEKITGLTYEAYQPMAERVMRDILESLCCEHPFEVAKVHHRIGFVPVGEVAIRMEVHSKHRAEAFAVLQKFMDHLKQEVPIWKTGAPLANPAADGTKQEKNSNTISP